MMTLHGSFDSFDRSCGNGSRNAEEDWLDEHTTASENEWSTASTTFYVSDAPKHRQQHFQTLYEKHNGWGESDRKSTIRRSHIVNDAETFCNLLELPEYQSQRIVEISKELDFSANRFGGKSYEKILLAVCSLVSDAELSTKSYASVEKRLIFTDAFRDLMDVNELGSREHNRIREMLRQRTNYF